jgi:hypothetical protein
MGVAALLMAAPAFGQNENVGQGKAIVTLVPKNDGDTPVGGSLQELKLEVNGKKSTVTAWGPAKGGVELVVLIDSASRSSLGTQLEEIAHFIQRLPPNTRAAIAYMENGRAAFAAPLTEDHEAVARGLHLPGGSIGSSGSPYFCLSELAKNWPSGDRSARREVVMVTDGVDNYEQTYDPNDLYVQSAIADSARAGLVVYAMYWKGQGRNDNTSAASYSGQNLLVQVTDATGGRSYWQGSGNPVSFEPFLGDLNRRLSNQYELSFTTPMNGKPQVETMKLKFTAPGEKGDAPRQVMVYREGVVSLP